MKTGIEQIAEERAQQFDSWSIDHDIRHHDNRALALAASLYASPVRTFAVNGSGNIVDPWHVLLTPIPDKRLVLDHRRRLVIAGALIAAELDRLQHRDNTLDGAIKEGTIRK